MNYLLAKVIFLARGNEADGWMQILIFVIMGVIYAVGSLAKAKANKLSRQEQEDDEQQQPPQNRQVQKQALRAGLHKNIATFIKANQPENQNRSTKTKYAQTKKTKLKPQSNIADMAAKKPLRGKRVETLKTTAPQEGISELLTDYEDQDSLKKAILHYEILGKPIALREPC
ncbi:MAG: hypothetical protein KAI59_01040 [Planctomycetes bacterium]|nr:hypothetical protein [Planctomycetota bacterium]